MPAGLSSKSDQTQLGLDVLNQKYESLKQEFKAKHQDFYDWLQKNSLDIEDLSKYTKDLLLAASIAGQMAMNQPVEAQVNKELAALEKKQKNDFLSKISEEELEEIMQKMVSYVNGPVGHLDEEQELYLEQQLTDILGFDVTAQLEGHRLNHSIGIMGGEQHLRRHPTDALTDHDAYLEAGIAPNRGAFGWFTEGGQLTENAIAREKYYFAVQTLYLEDWNTNYQELKPWYKFRKMIVINPAERIAVVGVVGDAGPAMWVKKQFGGSPEVIREGKIWSPKSRGRVILFFVYDPNDDVPLGPIDLDELTQKILKVEQNSN